jgi:Zn finger protein HypA/HybF involved in hydrogenase expression
VNKPTFKYCNKICQKKFEHLSYIERWKRGLETGNSSRNTSTLATCVSAHVRKYLFEKYGSACSQCGWNRVHPSTGKIPLTVEHKDGNFLNSSEDNLDLLCPNCHSLTLTYGSLNKGRGRETRIRQLELK